MPVTVTEDLIVGHRLRYNYGGRELKRVFFVEGLTSGSDTLIQAAAASGIPAFASLHPDDPNIIADDFDVEPWPATSKTSAKVTVLYHFVTLSPTFQPVIEFNATSIIEATNYDSDGNTILVAYTPPGGEEVDEIGQVTHNRPIGILTIERVEYEDPTPRLDYFGKLNSATFWGQDPWTWRITDIIIRKLLYTSGFNVKYTFEWDPKTHRKTAIYRDNLTGDIPFDVDTNPDRTIDSGNGWTNFWVDDEIDYAGLSLPDGFA